MKYKELYLLKFFSTDRLNFSITRKREFDNSEILDFRITGINNPLELTESEQHEIDKHFIEILKIVRLVRK